MPADCGECPCSYYVQTGAHEGMMICEAIEAKLKEEEDAVEMSIVEEFPGERPEKCPIIGTTVRIVK